MPSGGDWALERIATFALEYTQGCVLESNLFTKLDGSAVILNGYNRDTLIQDNEVGPHITFLIFKIERMMVYSRSSLTLGTMLWDPGDTRTIGTRPV